MLGSIYCIFIEASYLHRPVFAFIQAKHRLLGVTLLVKGHKRFIGIRHMALVSGEGQNKPLLQEGVDSMHQAIAG